MENIDRRPSAEEMERLRKVMEASSFLRRNGIHVDDHPFNALVRLTGEGWDMSVDRDVLTLRENVESSDFPRSVQFIAEGSEATRRVKAIATRSDREGKPSGNPYIVEHIFNVSSEGGFLMKVWGPGSRSEAVGFTKMLSICDSDGAIRYQVEERLNVKAEVVVS